jgi:integrase
MPDATQTRAKKRAKRNLKRLTEENVLKLPVKRHQYMAWDYGTDAARGLGVLVSPSGTRSYRVVFYYPGSSKPHSMHLGRVGEMALAEARKRALQARSQARDGRDPKAADVSKSDDFKSTVEDYVRDWQKGNKKNVTADEVQRILLKACAEWHHRPIATIRAQEIYRLLNTIRDGDGNGSKPRGYLANKVFAYLRTFFQWCAKPHVGKIKVSPMIGLDRPFSGEKRRERHFSDDEITAIWRAANTIGGTEGKFLQGLLLTGKRKGALSRMKWEQINAAWFWEPPSSESTKNKLLLPVPLSSLMQSVIGKRKEKGYVFAGPVEHTHHNADDARQQQRVRSTSGIADFYVHALRHTVETKLAALGVLPHIRDLLLDHQPQRGSGAVYDHHEYEKEMRAAIEKWADYVAGLVQPKLVAQKQEQA